MPTSRKDVFSSLMSQEWESGTYPETFQFLIRTVRQHDLIHLADVLASSFHTREGVMGWLYPLFRLGIYEDLRTRFRAKAPRQVCLVAVHRAASGSLPLNEGSDPLVGTVEMSLRTSQFWQPPSKPYLYLSNLAVHTDYRRQGIAKRLLTACEQIALEWGHSELYLHVLENNHRARRLYRQSGYRIKQVDSGLSAWLFTQPKQLLLYKRLSS